MAIATLTKSIYLLIILGDCTSDQGNVDPLFLYIYYYLWNMMKPAIFNRN